MKKKTTANKAETFEQEEFLKQRSHKDKERRALTSSLYIKPSPPKKNKPKRRAK